MPSRMPKRTGGKLFGHRRERMRRGVATVEVAICLPVLLVLTLATIDLCSLLFLKESVTIAAYEGARQGVGRGRTNADAEARVTEFLAERNITGGTVDISGPGFGGAGTLENITITVTVPCGPNLIAPEGLYDGLDATASVTMRKEYANLDEE